MTFYLKSAFEEFNPASSDRYRYRYQFGPGFNSHPQRLLQSLTYHIRQIASRAHHHDEHITMPTEPPLPPAPTLLSLSSLTSQKYLQTLLETLFEPTPPLETLLVPSVLLRLTAQVEAPSTASYAALVDLCDEVASGWTWAQKAEFLSGHPMIGDVKASGLSGKEQGGGTPAAVLAR